MATGIPSYKVILHGDYGSGKTSVYRRFMDGTFTTATCRRSTIGLDHCTRTIRIGSQKVKLSMWDTGSMERLSCLGSSYYRGTNAVLLCYSATNKNTFNILPQYLLDIVMNAEGAKIFLCGTMYDEMIPSMDDSRVSDAELDHFMTQCENVFAGVYKVSCKENIGLTDMFKDIANVLHEDSISRLALRRDLIHLELTKPGRWRCC